jgi:hypothetical protein
MIGTHHCKGGEEVAREVRIPARTIAGSNGRIIYKELVIGRVLSWYMLSRSRSVVDSPVDLKDWGAASDNSTVTGHVN